MKASISWFVVGLVVLGLVAGCSGDKKPKSIVVNSLEDLLDPPDGTVTLRSALAEAKADQRIVFDESLDGGTIELAIVGRQHTLLKGEVMGIRDEPSGPVSYLVGYFDRDYGPSALYASKDVKIDASALPSGITVAWMGGALDPARVLAVRGDLTLKNVSITGGRSIAEDISTGDPEDQPWTLARGGGLAVWGVARLVDCQIYDNHVEGDFDASRDRGAFGGGVFANIVDMENCVVSGNSVLGAGAAGGGVYSVGGALSREGVSIVEGSSITGNRINGLFAYGAGIYSDGGGIGNAKALSISNSTIARNLVAPPPGMPAFLLAVGYWRGGGVYMSNGSLFVEHCTVVENEVHGVPRTDSLDRPNLAGGIAATIGNAHAVEDLMIGQSIVAGNTVHEVGGEVYAHDIFTGSIFYFRSMGFNRIGVIDFSQILVPVGQRDWASLSRKHYPQAGDEDGVDVDDVLNRVSGIQVSDRIDSVGTDAPGPAVLYYEPQGGALDRVPADPYVLHEVYAEYRIASGAEDDFLEIMLARIETEYALPGFAAAFTAEFEAFLASVDIDDETDGLQPYTDPNGSPILTLADTGWFGPARTWPKELPNHPYIEFWHRLDVALLDAEIPDMGPELIADHAWAVLFSSGALAENPSIVMDMNEKRRLTVRPRGIDQLGALRPANLRSDIGAIEIP